MDAKKPDNGARLSRNTRKNVFVSVNYLTLLNPFLNDAACGVGGSGRSSGECRLITFWRGRGHW